MPRIDMTTLDEETLAEWLLGRRWFGSKARDVAHVRVMDLLTLHDGPPQLVAALVEARFPGGTHAVYQLLLSLREGVAGEDAIGSSAAPPSWTRSPTRRPCEVLGGLLRERAEVGDEHAKVTFHWLDDVEPPRAGAAVRGMGAEQSNSSVVFDDALVLKAFRRVEAGDNPELEMLRFLSERGFENVAPLGGWYEYEGDLMDATFGVVQRFVPDARDGWELALDELGDDPERFVERLHELGAVIGRMHTVLASDLTDPAFAPEEPSRRDARAAHGDHRRGDRAAVHRPAPRRARSRRSRPRRGGARPPAACSPPSARAAAHPPPRRPAPRPDPARGGDDGWIILDFEGEPARSLLERRRKRSPPARRRGHAALVRLRGERRDIQRGRPAPEGWEDRAREAFLAGYMETVDSSLLPPGEANTRAPAERLRTGEGRLRASLRAQQPPRLGPHPGRGDRPAARGADRMSAADQLVARELGDPHSLLGAHPNGDGVVVRAFRPGADAVARAPRRRRAGRGDAVARGGPLGGHGPRRLAAAALRPRGRPTGGESFPVDDPYRFAPTLGDMDLHLAGEGRHEELYEKLGAHVRDDRRRHRDVVRRVGARRALRHGRRRLQRLGRAPAPDALARARRASGSCSSPASSEGELYKFEIRTPTGDFVQHADPYAFATEHPPQTASVVHALATTRGATTTGWPARRSAEPLREPMSIYEVHLGSWRRNPLEDNRSLNYDELADELAAYVKDMGFTHVELMPVMGAPVQRLVGLPGDLGYFAADAALRHARRLRASSSTACTEHGIGVILDWVPAHFPRDAWALAQLRRHRALRARRPAPRRAPRLGHADLQLRPPRGAQLPASQRPVLAARATTPTACASTPSPRCSTSTTRARRASGCPTSTAAARTSRRSRSSRSSTRSPRARARRDRRAAEESTAWPGVSRPTYLGGLGFGFKWNMGWMHDTLGYFQQDPVYRRYHHHELTFSLMYAFSENFVLPLSPRRGRPRQGLAARQDARRPLAAAGQPARLYAYMWAHPGKKLLFMGCELAQEQRVEPRALARLAPARGPAARAASSRSCATSTTSTATRRRCGSVDDDARGLLLAGGQRRREQRRGVLPRAASDPPRTSWPASAT